MQQAGQGVGQAGQGRAGRAEGRAGQQKKRSLGRAGQGREAGLEASRSLNGGPRPPLEGAEMANHPEKGLGFRVFTLIGTSTGPEENLLPYLA